MRTLAVMMVLLLAGCAGAEARYNARVLDLASARSLEDVPLAGRDPACTRGCLATYSDCAGRSSMAESQVTVLLACKAALKACAATCSTQ